MSKALTQRKRRLLTLEDQIKSGWQEFCKTGLALLEIRKDELWDEHEECKSWTQYLREYVNGRFGIESRAAHYQIVCAEVRPKIGVHHAAHLSQRSMLEIARIAPEMKTVEGVKRDYDAIKKRDVANILKQATEYADNGEIKSSHVKKAVDVFLGIEPEANNEDDEPYSIDLHSFLQQEINHIKSVINELGEVPGDSWDILSESYPSLVGRLAGVCDELAELLRS